MGVSTPSTGNDLKQKGALNMSNAVEGVCEKCGSDVSINHEGALICNGCGVSSGVCTCGGRAATTWAAPTRQDSE